ncbi:MAG: phosphoglucosamine mutase, partial [Ilumatobacteraceae bacterium]|nr:phosphoglucosamine mutase [Ilumatobacteraceae bacterium]
MNEDHVAFAILWWGDRVVDFLVDLSKSLPFDRLEGVTRRLARLVAQLELRQLVSIRIIDDARGRYIEFVKQSLGNAHLDGMKIVVDCGHGAGYLLAPLIFKELGAKVVKLGVEPDGLNINAGVGALYPEFAGKVVKEQGADV